MKTKIYLPKNIFTKIFLSEIQDKPELDVEFLPSSLVAKRILAEDDTVGLIPSMDILSNKDLFVSSEVGVSFNALLSNSYIHFKEEQETIDELFIKGDVSSNEIILSKILFREFYDVEIKTTLLKREVSDFNENILVIGDENYESGLFLKGLSFAEEIIELINAPYINFVLASASEDAIKGFNSKYITSFTNGHSENFDKLLPGFAKTSLDFLSVNIQHLVFDFDEQDLEGIKQLLQMPYYHRMIKEIIDVKFV